LEALLAGLIGLGGNGGPGKDDLFLDTGRINTLDKPEEGKGKASPSSVTGQRDPSGGDESYVEFKAPTRVGSRSSVAYTKDMLSAKKKAEQAIDRKQIPKEHEKRVKEYFESLAGGKPGR